MHNLFVSENILYDGAQLSSLWAYREWGLQGDSIVGFRGPCRIDFKDMVDMEDVLKHSPIYSSDMLHFIVEHFEMDLEKTVLRQRLLIAIIKDSIMKNVIESGSGLLNRKGDDLYIEDGKLSISIATLTPVSTMIHTGLNVTTENVPVKAAGLLELGYAESRLPSLAAEICRAYAGEMQDIYQARCKVRGVK